MDSTNSSTNQDDRFYPKWTQDPEIALYSDWKIEITPCAAESSLSVAPSRYNVHRMMLGLSSRYFKQVFGNETFVESINPESKIVLPPLAAEAFTDMLDYCYLLGSNQSVIKTNNASGLLFLSKYFQIDDLKEHVVSFLDHDISQETCALYFQQARELKIDYVLDCIAHLCCKHPSILSQESALSATADVALWKAVLQKSQETKEDDGNDYGNEEAESDDDSHDEDNEDAESDDDSHDGGKEADSFNWSPSLALFLRNLAIEGKEGQVHEADKQGYQELTSPDLLPAISGKSLFDFLEIEKLFNADGNHSRMTSLQERCVTPLDNEWMGVDPDSLRGKLRTYSPVVLEELMLLLLKEVARQKAKKISLGRFLASLENIRSVAMQTPPSTWLDSLFDEGRFEKEWETFHSLNDTEVLFRRILGEFSSQDPRT